MTCEEPSCFCAEGEQPDLSPLSLCAGDDPSPVAAVFDQPKPEPSFFEFVRQMEQILAPTAAGKGYSTTGVDGPNALYEFVQSFAGDGHALGEIVYKAKRYAAKGDPTELVKIASWAFLIWRHRG